MNYLLILLLVCIYFPLQISAHSETVIIKMTSDGFEPREVTVDENSAIEFINTDSVNRWPASNPHPTHDQYPEFDSKKPIEPHKRWTFKPSRIGVLRYHDHLLPHKRGVLQVIGEEGEKPAKQREASSPLTALKEMFTKLVAQIKGIFGPKTASIELSPNAFKALNQKKQFETMRILAKEKGGSVMWNHILTIFKGEEGTNNTIHDLAHFGGNLLYDMYGFKGLSICTSEFAFGCYHGFLDKAFSASLDELPQAEKGCLSLTNSSSSGSFASCIHGIGHGVSSFYQVTDLRSSLAACERLTQGKQYCFDGVFMEFARDAPLSFYKKSDPVYPCNVTEGKHIFACGRNQPTVMLNRFNMTFAQTASVCRKALNEDFKTACFDALGFIAVSRSKGNVDAIAADCNTIGHMLYTQRCIQAAAGELVFQNFPNWQENAPKTCDALTGKQKISCNEYVKKIIMDYKR